MTLRGVGAGIALLAGLQGAGAAMTESQWNACMDKAQTGPEAQRIEREAGTDGLLDHAITKCGYLPIVGGKQLAKDDCDRLFEMAPGIDCEPFGGSAVDNNFLKLLDPAVFNEDRYWEACRKIQQRTPPMSRQVFGKAVCGE